MSYATFEDIDKEVTDLFKDDFDSKYTLKIKSSSCCRSVITTNVELIVDPKLALKPKVTLKWPHTSGFTLEKLEFTNECKATVETSLVGVVPNLKLEFKGNDSDKADLSLKYTIPAATITAEFDVNNLTRAETSVSAGHGDFVGGLSAKFTTSKDDAKAAPKVSVNVGAAYNVKDHCFTAVRAKENFNAFGLVFSYTGLPKVILAGSVDHSAKKTLATALTSYKYDDAHTIKAKANSEGVFSASIKRSCTESKFVVVGSVEVPSNLKTVKWGLNATIG